MSTFKLDTLDKSQQSPFLDKPKLIDGLGSFYDQPLEYEGEKYVMYRKPHKLFYPGIYLVDVLKLTQGGEYGDSKREYSSMIFENGKIRPFIEGVSINNYQELNEEHPIVDTDSNGYMKYDENLNCSNLEGLPEGYRPCRLKVDQGLIQLNPNNLENSNSMIYGIDENYRLHPIEGVPEGMYISSIENNIAILRYYKKGDGDDKYVSYFYDTIAKEVIPFVFKGFEDWSYKVDTIYADRNVISIVDDGGNRFYFYFDNKAELTETVALDIEAKITELNNDSETARLRLYDFHGKRAKEGFYHYKNGIVKPFEGLQSTETIGYSETYQFIDAESKVKALVVAIKTIHGAEYECRTFDEKGVIKPFEGLKEGWKTGKKILSSINGDFFFVPIKIKGFGDETYGLLSKDSQRIIFYNDMLISGIDPKEKELTVVTYGGPDCDIKLDDNERNSIMKQRDPNYAPDNSVVISKELFDLLETLEH